jgi:GT2 family glycosyltransferase
MGLVKMTYGRDVSVCLINHEGREHTLGCLRSILENTHSVTLEVFVVDNASQDGCADAIRRHFPSVHLLQNTERQSFTVNNNLAIKRSSGRYVLVLNNDTLVQDGALDALVRFMDQHTECGAATAKLVQPDGSAQHVYVRPPTLCSYAYRTLVIQNLSVVSAAYRRWLSDMCDYQDITEIENLTGACMFVRREVLGQVGIFDEGYDFYFEDVDWSYRIRQAGWRLYVVPGARIVHYGGATLDKVRVLSKISEYKSASRFFEKHRIGGAVALSAIKADWVLVSLLRLFGYSALALVGRDNAKHDALAYLDILRWHLSPRRETTELGRTMESVANRR